jgi:hypothetical protein
MHFNSFVPVFLVLAIAFSWHPFSRILQVEAGGTLATAPLTMIASAICVSGLGLALADNVLSTGLLISVLGLLIARAMRPPSATLAILLAAFSMAAYLQFRTLGF